MTDTGIVKIHGKEYRTVGKRIVDIRAEHPEVEIVTEVIEMNQEHVVVGASIAIDGKVIATGLAEESRSSSQINKTSALENCETSAVGRALAFAGYGGTEIASADEVANAIQQQSFAALRGKRLEMQDYLFRMASALQEDDRDSVKEIYKEIRSENDDFETVVWQLFDSNQKAQIKSILHGGSNES